MYKSRSNAEVQMRAINIVHTWSMSEMEQTNEWRWNGLIAVEASIKWKSQQSVMQLIEFEELCVNVNRCFNAIILCDKAKPEFYPFYHQKKPKINIYIYTVMGFVLTESIKLYRRFTSLKLKLEKCEDSEEKNTFWFTQRKLTLI